jgi:hypothetical protein
MHFPNDELQEQKQKITREALPNKKKAASLQSDLKQRPASGSLFQLRICLSRK